MKQTSYKRILVAVDFSENSTKAVSKASEMSRICHAELKLIHFVEIPVYPVLEDIAVMGMPGLWDETVTQSLIESSNKRLGELAKSYDIEKFETISGLASIDIVDYAARKKCDLIIMGAHGLKGIQHLIGSTTNSVINHAKCDVLAVHL